MDRWARAKADADRMLARAGFVDAECGEHMRDPLGRTSSHGRSVPAHVLAPLEAARRRDAAEYRDWARGVLRRYRFRSREERDVWARHADGAGLRDIARGVGWTYHRTRTTVGAIRQRAKEPKEQGTPKQGTKTCASIGTLTKKCDRTVLAALVAGVLTMLARRTRPTPSSCSKPASGS